MNGNFFGNPTFPTNTTNNAANMTSPPGNYSYIESLPMEQSYIENILRLNKGKMVKAYVSFPDSTEWRNKIFEGRIEQAGRDHLIISNPKNGEWYLILMIYLNYVTFDEKINYGYEFLEKKY